MKKSLVLFVIILSAISFSHVPFFLNENDFSDKSYFVEDVDLSQIYYYEFTGKEDISFIFESIDEKNLYILYGIPVGVPEQNSSLYFRPSLSIYDPKGNLIDKFDFTNSDPELMHEFFGDSYSFLYLRYNEPFKEDGLYKVTLSSIEPGKIWIAFGKREEFTAEQIFSLNKMIRDIRDFHGLKGLANWQKNGIGMLIYAAFVGLIIFL